ncbi:MAG: YjjG family noncanonical pyrimidine nucleotidase [Clostridia bacterium]|nr:YjjG family noncanonical pyrimidine nucleotidase [Clostridia bacterium]
MKYTTLLFDNDDTLMDFLDAERQGIERTFKENGIPYTEELLKSYSAINLSLWKLFEKGEIAKEKIYTERFRLFSEKHGIPLDENKIAKEYFSNLQYGHKCIDGAYELISNLYKDYDIYVITNGESNTQAKRIKDSGLLPFYKGVFVSEKTGYQKPHIEYFNYVFARINEKDKSKILVIGDSLSSDIKGGINAGLDTCWYNPKGAVSGDIQPTYEIHNLSELYNCL